MLKRTAFAACAALAVLASAARPQELTGSLRGRVADVQGFALPGAYIYVTSPAMPGLQTFITSDTGRFAFLRLPPGTYKVIVEMPGFKTVTIPDLQVRPGGTADVPVRLEATEVEEEITRPASAPMVDRYSPRAGVTLDTDVLSSMPLPRDFTGILALAPSVVLEDTAVDAIYFTAFGASARSNVSLFDGIDMTDPVNRSPMDDLNPDLAREVEFDFGGFSADVPPGTGAVVNVLPREGGNASSGGLTLYHTAKSWGNDLFPGAGASLAPPVDRTLWDASMNLGGPILEDRAWFYGNARVKYRSRPSPFPGAQDPTGLFHSPYDFSDRRIEGFFRLTTQVTSQARAYAQVGYDSIHQPFAEVDLGPLRPSDATRSLSSGGFFIASGGVTYALDPRTSVDVRAGYVTRGRPLKLNSAGANSAQFVDPVAGWVYGSADFNERRESRQLHAVVSLSHFAERLLGAPHVLSAGGDYENSAADWSTWKANDLQLTRVGTDPYFFGTAVSPKTGATVGEGLVGFFLAPPTEGSLLQKSTIQRLGFYAQDVVDIARRASLTLGLRFDHSAVNLSPVGKAAGSAAAVAAGKAIIQPVSGINPYDAVAFSGKDGMVNWNALTPRAGLAFDVLGNGRTVLTASFARLTEPLTLAWPQQFGPISPGGINFFRWFDENKNAAVDATDTFAAAPGQAYNIYSVSFFGKRVAPDLSAPRTTEWTAGIRQQVTRDFTLSADIVVREQTNLVDTVLFDPATGQTLSEDGTTNPSFWVPFPTQVPGQSGTTSVTVFFPSTAIPGFFFRLANVPGLERRYRGLTISAYKRMSSNWQLGGSLALGRSTGLLGVSSAETTGFTGIASTPNFFVNRGTNDRLPEDRPVILKLYGTYRLPWDAYVSLVYSAWSGAPQTRTVTVIPPADWAAAEGAQVVPVTVRLEDLTGARRSQAYQRLDGRLEKGFRIGGYGFSLMLDVFNVLGQKSSTLDIDEDGTWSPTAPNSTVGTRVFSPLFNTLTSVRGRRAFQLGLRLNF